MGINHKIRRFCGDTIKDNRWLLLFTNWILRKIRLKRFIKEQEFRKDLSIFDYKKLAAPIPFCPIEPIREANFYGNVSIIREFSDCYSGEFTMEHGLMYGEYMQNWYRKSTVHKIITINNIREDLISNNLNKQCLAIGPYIHYCSSLLSDVQLKELKFKLGKTILFIPVHSTSEKKYNYNISRYIEDLIRIKKELGFKTIIVCLHHYDINHSNITLIYEKAGFKIVTAGNGYDNNFLPRLKSIITLADLTISNAVGTHTGYCIYLNRPHWIPWSIDWNKYPLDYQEIGKAFTIFSPKITSSQFSIISKYWGFKCIKDKNQIRDFILQSYK